MYPCGTTGFILSHSNQKKQPSHKKLSSAIINSKNKMKKKLLLSFVLYCCLATAYSQTNYLDSYIGATVTATVVATASDSLNEPRDLDFKPNSNELWVCNYGGSNGGDMVIFYNAGFPNQMSEYRKDTHTSHFMRFPSAFAFGDDGKLACVSEIQNTSSPSSTFMGPALWLSDTNIYARVFQNNWVSGLPLGSHVDMLHQSPFAMGIAHDSAMAYWVMDGYFGNICKYDFVNDHGPGYDDHSAGKIWRYTDVSVTRVPLVPSHMVLDKMTGWLYFIDGGPKQIKRMDTHSGTETGNLTTPSTANETLAGYKKVEFANVEVLGSTAAQPCGIDFYNNRLVVSDYVTGEIYLYSTNGAFTLLQTIQTGHPGMMGVKVGPDGHIWCVNHDENKVYRLDAIVPSVDAAILSIMSPEVENYQTAFYSTRFNVCDGNITPSALISNRGTNNITDMEIHYMIDEGIHTVYNWTGSLAPGSSASISLPSCVVLNGVHRLDVMILNVNGTADNVDLNNRMTGTFRVVDPPVTLPLTEGFSSLTFPPAGWNYIHFNKKLFMSRAAVGGFGASTGSLKMDNFSEYMDITGQKDYLFAPIINMAGTTANVRLKFNVAYARYNGSTNDQLQVLASTDCGNSWSVVYDKSGTQLATSPDATTDFTPTSSQWRTDSVSLAAYAGLPEVIFSFTTTSNYGNNVYIDDIQFIDDVTIGLQEHAASETVSVYPNPSNGMVTLHVSKELLQDAIISVYSCHGQLVKSATMASSGNSLTLDLSGFAKGVYAVRVENSRTTTVKMIVIQ
jgi:hypothetical protein